MRRPVSRSLGLVLCLLSVTQADEHDDAELPSIEMLEFLGDWETVDGQWVPPTELESEIDSQIRDELSDERDE